MFAYLQKKENTLKFGTTLDTYMYAFLSYIKNDNNVLVSSQVT